MQRRFITPWLKPEPLFRLSELSREQQKCVDVIHGFTGRVRARLLGHKLRHGGRFPRLQAGSLVSPSTS